MLNKIETSPASAFDEDNPWRTQAPSADFLAKHPAEDVAVWRDLRDQLVALVRDQGWTKADVARRMGMKDSTFSQWFSGKVLGTLANTNDIASRWLAAVEQGAGLASALPSSPSFLPTKAAGEIYSTLMLAQMTSGFVTITLDAGRGKTTAARHYRDSRPHVYLVTLNPKVKSVHGALNLLAYQLGIRVFNQAELVETIGQRLSKSGDGSLLIIDEAQHADTETVNQLRYFSDNFKIGVALMGNASIRLRIKQGGHNAASRDQLTSRITKNLQADPGLDDDLRTFIAGWNITDPACVKFLFAIGKKGGALRQVDNTIKIACLLTRGGADALEEKHLRAAWKNRALEDME